MGEWGLLEKETKSAEEKETLVVFWRLEKVFWRERVPLQ
jgi:hypothetical protein